MAKKTLLQLVQTFSKEMNLPSPVVALSSEDQNVIKIIAQLDEVLEELVGEFDWQILQRRGTLTTVQDQEAYDLPSDIARFTNNSHYKDSTRWAVPGSLTPVQWSVAQAGGALDAYTQFRVYGDQVHLIPTPGESGTEIHFEYISNQCVEDATTHEWKSEFTSDADICLFDHRLVINGMKWKWLGSLDMDTTIAVTNYERELNKQKGSDVPGQRLNLGGCGGLRLISNANIADYGWDQ